MKKKKKKELKGINQTGVIFIGDPVYMQETQENNVTGVITPDPLNPFKDWDKFLESHPADKNMEFPDSIAGDRPGRGVVIHTNTTGAFVVKKQYNADGSLKAVRIVFK